MKCLSCEHMNREGRAFCAQCGAATPVTCKTCCFLNEIGDRFCGGCGSELTDGNVAPVSPRLGTKLPTLEPSTPSDVDHEAERRPLTIMFTDLVGSTQMSLEMDAEDLRDIILGYQHGCTGVIESYGGFVANYMGDGIMAYFGYPEAREDDAERAVRAALKIVETVRTLDADVGAEKDVQLRVRVGLASGLVVVGDLIGEGASGQRAVVGETPNLAARMQSLAVPNSVVVDPAAYRLAGKAFKTRDLGLMDVKGSPKPIQVWQILEPHNPQHLFDTAWTSRLSPLVGRADELNRLREQWKCASAGQGQVAMISGEAGIGKTRLAQTAYARIVDIDIPRIRYICSPLHTNSAFYPFVEQFERAAGIDQAEDADQKFKKVRIFLQRYSEDTDERRALLARLLAISPERRYEEVNLSQTQLKLRLNSLFAEQLTALTHDGPMLALFEDIHWADPSSLELLDSIVSRVKDIPLMLICTHRFEHIERWGDHEHVSTIQLQRLDEAKCGELIERLLEDAGLPAQLKQSILKKTDGVPLFVEELIRTLKASAGDDQTGSPVEWDRIVPDTLQSSLMSRLDRLGSAKAVAQICAVIGREFHYKLLAAVAPQVSQELESALKSLEGEALINRRGLPPDSRYAFRHGLLRDTAYQSLLRRTRQAIHSRIAAVLEHEFKSYWEPNPEILAHHLTEAHETKKAIDYWEAAARRAARNSANKEAEHHFQRAIELVRSLPTSSVRARRELGLLTAMGGVLINNYGPGSPLVTDIYRRCHAICEEIGSAEDLDPSEDLFVTLWGLWRTCESLNVAMDLVNQMRKLGEKMRRPDLIMQAHHSGWATLFNLGELQSCLESVAIGESLYDAEAHCHHSSLYGGHDPQVCANGIGGVALCLRGFPDQASDRIEHAIDFAKRLNHPGSLAHALDFATTFDRMCNHPTRTLERAEALVTCGAQNEFADYEVRGRAFRGWALARLSDGKQGLEELRASILVQRGTGTSEDFSFFLEMLAEVLGLVGQPEEGLTAIEEALQDELRNEAKFWSSTTKRRQALLIIQCDADRIWDAIVCLREAASIAHGQQARLLELQANLDLARLLKQAGEISDARSVIEGVYQSMTEGYGLSVMVETHEFIKSCH